MRSSLVSVVFAAAILLPPLHAQTTKTVTIFHINDTHSYLFPWGEKVGDIPQEGAASRLIKRLRDLRQLAVNPLLLHGGDSFTGGMAFNRFLGTAEFTLFDSIGVDAMALGNHDFDIRPFRLANAIANSNAHFPFLSANIVYNNDTSGLAQIVKPFVVINAGNVAVGVFGLTTTSTVSYGESVPITFESTVSVAGRMVDSLKARNVDLIIALTHLGVSSDRQLARQVSGIDVIVGGHSHTPLATPILEESPSGDSTIIVQAGSKWKYLGKLELTIAGASKIWTYHLDEIGAPLPGDPLFDPYLDALRDSITDTYGPVFSDTVGIMTEEFPSSDPLNGNLENPLLNLVADAYRVSTGADVALETGALLRQQLHAGRVTTSEIRNMLSWSYDPQHDLGKRLSIVRVTGLMLKTILSTTLSFSFGFFGGGIPSSLTVQASGLQFVVDGWGSFPQLRDLTVGGVPVLNSRIYSVALNEFVADLAGQYPLIQFLSRRDTTFGPDAALSQYLKSISPFGPTDVRMGRIWDANVVPQLSYSLHPDGVLIEWVPISPSSQFNIYRIQSGATTAPVKLNGSPLVQTHFLDPEPKRGDIFKYQIEELLSDGTTYLLPQQEYQVGGLPSTAYLLQNYPNPFNATTRIVYGVPAFGRVSVQLYDVLGRLVRTLVDEKKNQGEFEVSWDGKDQAGRKAASGVYFVTYSAQTFRQTSRVLLLR